MLRLLCLTVLAAFTLYPHVSSAEGVDQSLALTRVIGRPQKASPQRTWSHVNRPGKAKAKFVEYDAVSGLARFERPDGRLASTSQLAQSPVSSRFSL